MKILCIISALSQGGAEKVMVDFADRMSREHDIHLLTIRPEKNDFFKLSKKISRHSLNVDNRRIWNFSSQKAIINGIRNHCALIQPDYVVSFVIKTNIYTSIALRHKNYPYILCEHSIIKRKDNPFFLRILRRIMYKKADKLGVLTETSKRDIMKWGGKYLKSDIVVLPNPVDIQRIITGIEKVDYSDGVSISSDDFIICGVGRLIELKGFHYLIKATELLLKKGLSVKTIIWGEGPERSALESLVESCHLKDKVFLPGSTTHIHTYIRNSNLFVSTSMLEGFPVAICEAMALKVPIVAFNVPGVRELVKNNETGISVLYGDYTSLAGQIERIMEGKVDIEYITGRAYTDVLHYSPEEVDRIWKNKVFNNNRKKKEES